MLLRREEAENERGDHAAWATACNQRLASASPVHSAGPTGEPR
jgi:hypothetical protein